MNMQRTETACWRRLATFGLALVLIVIAAAGAACGDDAGKSDANAELQEFIRLDVQRLSADGRRPVELGTEEATTLARILGASPSDEVHTALTQAPPAGRAGFGFVLSGCAETGARLVITSDVISAELTGGEGTNCEAPVYFLATFHMPTEDVPEGAVLD